MFVIADDVCECWCAGELKLKSTCISYLFGFESKQTNHNINSKNISQMTNESSGINTTHFIYSIATRS